MAGRISEPRVWSSAEPHTTSTLAEMREWWAPVAADRRSTHEADLIAACEAVARQWCEARGVEADIESFVEQRRVGVRVTLIIGRYCPGDREVADSSGDGWQWSARWQHWADKLGRLRRTAYTPAVVDTGGDVIDFGARLAMRDSEAMTGPLG